MRLLLSKSIFRKVPTENVSNLVRIYKVTPYFSDDELGKTWVLYSSKYSKLLLQMQEFKFILYE